MTTLTRAIAHSAGVQWSWIKNGLMLLGLMVLTYLSASNLESNLFPVLKDIQYSNVRIVGDDLLCADFAWTKKRQGTPIFFAAQVYEGDNPVPQIRGVQRPDKSPFGGDRYYTAPPGRYYPTVCVQIRPDARLASRIGVRIYIEYSVPLRPWTLRQQPIWIDYPRH